MQREQHNGKDSKIPGGSANVRFTRRDYGTGFFCIVKYRGKLHMFTALSCLDGIEKGIRFCREALLLGPDRIYLDGAMLGTPKADQMISEASGAAG